VIDLSVEIAGVTLPNPVMPASGTYEVGSIHDGFFSPAELGAVINKTIFLDPRPGNPPPRIWETPCGMLNAIGIPSEGLHKFLEEQLPRLRSLGPPVIVSIAGNSLREWRDLAQAIGQSGSADMIELDLSCPNTEQGFIWAAERQALSEAVAAAVEATALPVISKLSPNVRDISEMALVAEAAGTAALSMVNSYVGMAIDVRTHRPALGNITGGLTGPAIRPLAVYSVFSTFKKVGVPIIGIGGIATWKDAVEFLLAGASAVAVGTQNFVNPLTMKEVVRGIADYTERSGFSSVRELIGLAHERWEM
jgi:dihydroorotate dehydrogenase (NAD+) catalytic subunit